MTVHGYGSKKGIQQKPIGERKNKPKRVVSRVFFLTQSHLFESSKPSAGVGYSAMQGKDLVVPYKDRLGAQKVSGSRGDIGYETHSKKKFVCRGKTIRCI